MSKSNQEAEAMETETAAASLDDGSHLDDLVAPDLGLDNEIRPDAVRPVDAPEPELEELPPELITLEQFIGVWEYAFSLPAAFDADFKPLEITPDKKQGSDAAASLTYDMIGRYFPSFLASSPDMARSMMAAGFVWGQVMTARAIMAHKARPKAQPKPETQEKQEEASPFSCMDRAEA